MQLGITLWGFDLGYREAVDLARRAEDEGFHNLFMVEGVLSNDGLTTVALMAARTSRLLIGTNIANVYLRHPVMLGTAAVAIDDVAPERLVLGLGPNNQSMVTQGGFTWRDPREVLRETTATLRTVFAGQAGGPRPPRRAPTRTGSCSTSTRPPATAARSTVFARPPRPLDAIRARCQ